MFQGQKVRIIRQNVRILLIMEHIVSFIHGQIPNEDRFYPSMCGVTFPDKSYHITRDQSDVYVLEYVISGVGDVLCAAGRQPVRFSPKAGDVYLLPIGSRHDYRALPSDPFKKIWMNLSGTLVDALYREYQLDRTCHYPSRPLYQLFRSFLTLCEENQSNTQYISQKGALIVHEIFASLSYTAAPSELRPRNDYATCAKTYIDRHIKDSLTMRDVAEHVGISTAHLNRIFPERYGVSAFKYYSTARMELACALLRNTNIQIREIARQLHFADEHYFSSAFRKAIGVAPREYRGICAGTTGMGAESDIAGSTGATDAA